MIATGRITEVRKILDVGRSDGKRVGFVPTMGALHEGHRSLIRRAREGNDFVVVSIYVNPTQFNQSADLDAYPRTFADDLEACAAEGTDLVFHPDDDEIYPRPSLTSVNVSVISEPMEGASRPGHFAGVALVCTKLFNIVGPCRAYFGQKDAQQAAIIKRLVKDLAIDTEIIVLPTVREDSGLAVSSRNLYLSQDEQEAAAVIHQALAKAKAAFKEGERSGNRLTELVRSTIEAEPRVRLDYVNVADADTFEKMERIEDRTVLIAVAAYVGKTRLIDNTVLNVSRKKDASVPKT
jgi:pantoate--beta-alanine ligase